MHLDEWVRIVKSIGPTRFKDVGTAFLRERFGRPVQYADGTGDGGVDAWVILSDEPRVWRAAQFYAGEGDWGRKLEEDVGKLAEFRRRVPEDRQSDFETLYFVCGQQPSATTFEVVASELRRRHGVVVT